MEMYLWTKGFKSQQHSAVGKDKKDENPVGRLLNALVCLVSPALVSGIFSYCTALISG